jgi:hypothetical protein
VGVLALASLQPLVTTLRKCVNDNRRLLAQLNLPSSEINPAHALSTYSHA